MKHIIRCSYCGSQQEESQGFKCIHCGADLEGVDAPGESVFICYSRKDSDFVNQLNADLKLRGVNTWLDVEDIPGNIQANLQGFRTAINDALENCTAMLVILSPDSLASTEVQAEWNAYASRKQPIYPILVRECQVPYYLRMFQIWDLRSDYQPQVDRLASILRGEARPKNSGSLPGRVPTGTGIKRPGGSAGMPARINRDHIPPAGLAGTLPGRSMPARSGFSAPVAGAPEVQRDLTIIGKELWTLDLSGEVRTAPLVGPDGTIHLVTHNGMLMVIAPGGKLLWQSILGGATSWGYSRPVLGPDGGVLVVYDGQLLTFDRNGTPGWTMRKPGSLTALPAVSADGTVFLVTNRSNLCAVSPGGRDQWNLELCQVSGGGTWPGPVVGSDGIVYAVCKGKAIYAIDPRKGSVLWMYNTNDRMESTPAADRRGYAYFASTGGWVFCLKKDGKPAWQASVAGPPNMIQVIDAPIVHGPGDVLYIVPRHGTMYALNTADGSLRWSAKVGGQGVGINPVAVNQDGFVFVRNLLGELRCFSPEGKTIWSIAPADQDSAISPPACGKEGQLYITVGRKLISYQVVLK